MALSRPFPESAHRPSAAARRPQAHDAPLFEMAQQFARLGTWSTPLPFGGKVRWSAGTYRIFGVPEGTDIDVETFLGFVHPDDRERVRSRRSADVPDGDETVYRIVRADGEVRWLRTTVAVFQEDGDQPRRIMGIAQDITEEKLAVEALAASEARYRCLAESGIIGIAVTDGTGHVYKANDAYLSTLGMARDDLEAGRILWTKLTPPEWQATDDAKRAELRATGAIRPWQKEMYRKDGTRVPVLVGVARLDETHSIVFTHDLTEQARAQAALHASEEHLRRAQKMEAIGLLAGGIAHDFNNLLTVMLTYADLLRDSFDESDPRREDAREIHDAAERAAQRSRGSTRASSPVSTCGSRSATRARAWTGPRSRASSTLSSRRRK